MAFFLKIWCLKKVKLLFLMSLYLKKIQFNIFFANMSFTYSTVMYFFMYFLYTFLKKNENKKCNIKKIIEKY